jgi:hypothetical protein
LRKTQTSLEWREHELPLPVPLKAGGNILRFKSLEDEEIAMDEIRLAPVVGK